jgi:protein-S-isoprenylcysteine O-methyltransferase Ste14
MMWILVFAYAIPTLWALWVLCWILSAIGVKRARWHESILSAVGYRLILLVGVLLMARPQLWPAILRERFLPESSIIVAVGILLVAAGLSFSVWARVHLAGNWSGNVTVKENHELVQSGPYRWLRHPIYTGILLAIAGTCLAVGEWRVGPAMALAIVSFMVKSRIEERALRVALPDYAAYEKTTWAIIPYVY